MPLTTLTHSLIEWGYTSSSTNENPFNNIELDIVITLDESGNIVWSNYQTTYPSPSITLMPGGISGRYVRVSDPDILRLTEVQVIGY